MSHTPRCAPGTAASQRGLAQDDGSDRAGNQRLDPWMAALALLCILRRGVACKVWSCLSGLGMVPEFYMLSGSFTCFLGAGQRCYALPSISGSARAGRHPMLLYTFNHITVQSHLADPGLLVCVQGWGVTLADDFTPSAATTEYTSFLLTTAEKEVSARVA